jgi:hypothetical protein
LGRKYKLGADIHHIMKRNYGKSFPFLLKRETMGKDMRSAVDRNPRSRGRKKILTPLS